MQHTQEQGQVVGADTIEVPRDFKCFGPCKITCSIHLVLGIRVIGPHNFSEYIEYIICVIFVALVMDNFWYHINGLFNITGHNIYDISNALTLAHLSIYILVYH